MRIFFQINTALRILLLTFAFTSVTHAYMSLNETGELLQEGDFRLGFLPQLKLSDGGGTNYGAFLDIYNSQSVNSRFALGGGDVDFWAQASSKWIPFPDYQRQPAMGVRGALLYAREANLNFYSIQVTPLISKITDSEYGKMIPYIGLPVTLTYSDNRSRTGLQFAIGNEWVVSSAFQIGAELDLNLSNTTSAISVHLNFPFDGNVGYRK